MCVESAGEEPCGRLGAAWPHDDYTEVEARYFMAEAILEAEKSFQSGEVAVGCVFVDRRSKQIIERGGNKTNVEQNVRKGW